MRVSAYFLPTLKENPTEAQIVSHRLMLRAGMIRQSAAGIYSWLPMGLKVLRKVENIIRGLKERGIPMVLVSHNLRQVFDLVDRIVVFRRGRIVASLRRDETDGNDIVSYITGVKGNADGAIA